MKLRAKIAVLLALALIVNGMAFIHPTSAGAAKKVSLSTKKLTVKVGQFKKLKLRNNKKKVKWTVTSGKKNITLKSRKKTGVTVTGKKKGATKVQAKIGKKKYTCKVTIQAKATAKPTKTPGQDEALTLRYDGKNLEDIAKQIKNSDVPVYVIVGDNVTSIGDWAFSGCSGLTSIGNSVFWGCSSLTNIEWKGTTYTSVGAFMTAFENGQ